MNWVNLMNFVKEKLKTTFGQTIYVESGAWAYKHRPYKPMTGLTFTVIDTRKTATQLIVTSQPPVTISLVLFARSGDA